MAVALIFFGALFFVSAIRGTHVQLGDLLKGQFSGVQSFLPVLATVTVLAGFGAVKEIRPVSQALLALFIVSYFLATASDGALVRPIGKSTKPLLTEEQLAVGRDRKTR